MAKTLTQSNKLELVDLILNIDLGLNREELVALSKHQLLEIGKVLTKKKYAKSRDDVKNLFVHLVIHHNLSLAYITNPDKVILTNAEVLSCLSSDELQVLKAYLGVLINNEKVDVGINTEVLTETASQEPAENDLNEEEKEVVRGAIEDLVSTVVTKTIEELVSDESSSEEPSVSTTDSSKSSKKPEKANLEVGKSKDTDKSKPWSGKVPKQTDPEWTAYVLSFFIPEELSGKHLRVDGLRRVAELLIGRIIDEDCQLVASPTVDNGMRACVRASITFDTITRARTTTVSALADCSPDNSLNDTDDGVKYSMFPTSLAETRAKGRCFRQALKLRHVVTAEEVMPKITDVIRQEEGNIGPNAITNIRVLSDRAEVSITKLLESLEFNPEISKLTHSQAIVVQKHLATLTVGNVPDSLKRPIDKKS